jgi:leucyl-tRNA synthetase
VLGKPYSVHNHPWPEVNEEATRDEEITLIVQVNGKVRDRITVPAGILEGEAKTTAITSDGAQRFMEGREPRKVIYIPGKLVNIVV